MTAGTDTTSDPSASSLAAVRSEGGRAPRVLAVCLGIVVLLVFLVALFPIASQASVAKGMCDIRIQDTAADPTQLLDAIDELDAELGAGWVRLAVSWRDLEPTPGVYSEAQLANLDYLTGELSARGIQLLATICYTPRWASDQSFWDSPPGGHATGYQSFYPIDDAALDDFGRTAEFLAARYAGRIAAYEVWNEPNLWPYLYPQRTDDDRWFAAHTYLKMLKAWSAGIRRGDPNALVVAGGTAPLGRDDVCRTSPQSFARYLRSQGAAEYFDAYSHHPYTPGGTTNKAPDRPPNDTKTTVTLYNLRTLLDVFPGKPFYLTEYGYNTSASRDFGGMTVTKVQQAAWLRKAYLYAGRYSQVKALFWYLVQDAKPSGLPSDHGVYTGLREADGARKLSWFAFAGGNRLTIEAPRSVRRGRSAWVSGVLTNAALGALPGKTLVLQVRRAGTGTWGTLASHRTGASGRCHFYVKPRSSTVYRVVWRGVKTSATRAVRVR